MISYAQNLEDVMLARAFVGVTQGFYIDVGGYDPDNDSVTRFFYDSGWRGINVEPVPEQYEEFVRRRPRDVNLRTALGRADGQLRFHDFSPSGLSTMDPVAAARLREHGYTCREYDVPVTTLAAVCRAHAPATIDFLKIDGEGAEGEVIAGADWQVFRPRVIVVEATRLEACGVTPPRELSEVLHAHEKLTAATPPPPTRLKSCWWPRWTAAAGRQKWTRRWNAPPSQNYRRRTCLVGSTRRAPVGPRVRQAARQRRLRRLS